MINVIVAVANNGVIGAGATLPWRLPSDLKRFKQLTLGHTLVMGRRTYDSIGRPLPGRRTIVVSRDAHFAPAGVEVARSVDAALALAGDAEIFVAGGAEIYAQTLARADRLYWTRVDLEPTGDVVFPEVEWKNWRLLSEEPSADDPCVFCVYQRA